MAVLEGNQEAFVRKDEISVRMKTLGRNFLKFKSRKNYLSNQM